MEKAIKIVVKKKNLNLFDRFDLTKKNVICEFRYLIICFDQNQFDGKGIINLRKQRLEELIVEQNISLSTEQNYQSNIRESDQLLDILSTLQEWHPQISKLEIKCQNLYEIDDLMNYQ